MEHVTFAIDGSELEVVSLRGEEAVSSLFRYEVVCPYGDGSPDELLGRAATIDLVDAFGGRRVVRGIVAEAIAGVSGDAGPVLSVVVRPEAFRLTLGRDSRVFHDAGVVDIVRSVLERGGVAARLQVTHTYAPRAYTAQYREDDWAFIERQLAAEGIYYWFDHDEGESSLVLGDRSENAPDIFGGGGRGAAIRFIADAGMGMGAEAELVVELGPAALAAPDQFRLRAFDPARPAFEVKAEGDGRGALRVYDAPMGSTEDPDVLAARAAVLEQRAAAQRSGAVGRATSVRLVPGRTVEIVGHPAAHLDGRLFVTASLIHVAQRRRGGAASGERRLDVRFRAVPSAVAFRPAAPRRSAARSGAHGAIGLQSGVIVGPVGAEVHSDAAGRVRMQHHWDREGERDDRSGKWVRVAQRCTAGAMLLPRTGWNVMALHEEGSADAPMVQARVFDAEHPPPYNLPKDKTRTVFKTATVPGGGSFNEIRYESKAGAEEMLIVASRDLTVLAQNAKTEAVASNAFRAVARDHALTVKGNALESVAGNQTTSIGGDEKETVTGARQVKVTAAETKRVGGGRRLKVGGSAQTSVIGGRDASIGAAQIDVSLGSVKAAASTIKVLVGGALVKLTPRGITETIGTTVTLASAAGMLGLGGVGKAIVGMIPSPSISAGGSMQLIGASKLELAGMRRTVVAGKTIRETVGGVMMLMTNDFADAAGVAYNLKAGAAILGESPSVLVEATGSIAIRCGGSKIVVSKAGITITGLVVDLSKATAILAKGETIEHNG
jgi:type VI secretion system secreted protein VgrG